MYQADWVARIITIPVSDLTLVSGADYELNMDSFWIECRRLEAAFDGGLGEPQVLNRIYAQTISGSTGFPLDIIINSYQFVFDPLAERVDLRGSNTNLADRGVLVNNGVLVVPHNSWGNSTVTVGSGVTAQDKVDIANQVWDTNL